MPVDRVACATRIPYTCSNARVRIGLVQGSSPQLFVGLTVFYFLCGVVLDVVHSHSPFTIHNTLIQAGDHVHCWWRVFVLSLKCRLQSRCGPPAHGACMTAQQRSRRSAPPSY